MGAVTSGYNHLFPGFHVPGCSCLIHQGYAGGFQLAILFLKVDLIHHRLDHYVDIMLVLVISDEIGACGSGAFMNWNARSADCHQIPSD